MADEIEVGKVYEVEVTELSDDGPFGLAYIGDALVNLPNAKVGDKRKIKVTAVVPSYWTGRNEVYFVEP